ncbi:hypothetical protein Esi_0337_0014 [Ectocarpus siliculosus]|uniref:Uncharacterized protein n=1 Tax=Ectocarpus siliculosus TaxID=2880 RepID=D7FXZ9_ECTSI|nr:hypothetical protein Esi_0337_0014 [Ectocarpus siliculosus]|eukprot:CBJ32412.1 hypothetical protein Esi_0337_0014 [Ectocarpus siliculosus]
MEVDAEENEQDSRSTTQPFRGEEPSVGGKGKRPAADAGVGGSAGKRAAPGRGSSAGGSAGGSTGSNAGGSAGGSAGCSSGGSMGGSAGGSAGGGASGTAGGSTGGKADRKAKPGSDLGQNKLTVRQRLQIVRAVQGGQQRSKVARDFGVG